MDAIFEKVEQDRHISSYNVAEELVIDNKRVLAHLKKTRSWSGGPSALENAVLVNSPRAVQTTKIESQRVDKQILAFGNHCNAKTYAQQWTPYGDDDDDATNTAGIFRSTF
ncbi:jg22955 [Pararge aegeria aegeria]|uniref:Jg22955 protein n=1 Tax=Pararge aegeria aegeria TaxID=348720 RepID=A0A8S4QX54_9NEOP|nr:jg22955 [Pararge aegeria aegeria]